MNILKFKFKSFFFFLLSLLLIIKKLVNIHNDINNINNNKYEII